MHRRPMISSLPKHERLWIFVGTMLLVMLAPAGSQASCTSFDGHLEWVGGIGGGTFVQAYDVAVSGTTAYLRYYNNGMSIFDISDPASPVSLGFIGLHGKGYSITASGTHAYAASGSSGTAGYFEIVDVSNPSSPVLQASIAIPGWGVDVEVSGNYAYVVEGTGALRVIDVSTPTLPVIVGNLVIPGNSTGGITLSGSVAYVANGPSGIVVINISSPTNPVILTSMAIPGWSSHVAVFGTRLYVTNPYGPPNGPQGLQVLDVSNPSFPTIIGNLVTSAGPIAVSGTIAYTSGGSWLKTIDVSNPASPAIMDSIGYSGNLALSGRLICLADGNLGLQLIEHCILVQQVVNLETSGFTPNAVTVPPGTQITWVKVAGGNHTTTNGTGPLDPAAGTLWDGQLRASSPQFVHVFTNAGTFPYFCRNHPSETGTITVSAQTGIDERTSPHLRLTASPNPFRGNVDLEFDLERAEQVSVVIVDLAGRKVRDLVTGEFPAGTHRITWEGRDERLQPVRTGLYFARLYTGDGQVEARKLFKIR